MHLFNQNLNDKTKLFVELIQRKSFCRSRSLCKTLLQKTMLISSSYKTFPLQNIFLIYLYQILKDHILQGTEAILLISKLKTKTLNTKLFLPPLPSFECGKEIDIVHFAIKQILQPSKYFYLNVSGSRKIDLKTLNICDFKKKLSFKRFNESRYNTY